MMFTFGGSDSESDNGYWEVLIRAPRIDSAKYLCKCHLKKMGRTDLIQTMELKHQEKVKTDGVFYSTVQTGSSYLNEGN